MKDINYESSRPLMRLEKGDKAIISFYNFPFVKEKDKQKYKDIPEGKYEAVCIEPYYLECTQQPLLSGRYNYWRGDKWGCSEGIYADEIVRLTKNQTQTNTYFIGGLLMLNETFMCGDNLVTKEEWLQKQPTRKLLVYLKHARACGFAYSPFDSEVYFSIEDLKAVLATREHIPNKKESKIIRQQKAIKC